MSSHRHVDYVIEQLQKIILAPEQAAAIAQNTIAKLRGRTCPGCGVYFIALHGNQKYHVPACGFLARQKRYFSALTRRQEEMLKEAGAGARLSVRGSLIKPD
jgi:hypothetical protein